MNKRVSYSNLSKFVENILTKVGLDEYSVKAVTVGLCETSVRGVDSHGVRLLPHYVNSAINGRKNPNPNYKYQQNLPTIGHLDADDAFGHAAGMKAIEYCMDMADKYGTGIVSVSGSSHPGAMASMALKAARKGFIAFAFTHADSLIMSHNGVRPYFGTNPICFACPRVEKEPYCLDMATSIAPWNRVLVHRNSNTDLPEGIAYNSDGEETVNPQDASSLFPSGSHKGYGLASMVEVLCGIYSGMNFGRNIPSMYGTPIKEVRKLGQFYMVMRVDGAIPEDQFIETMQLFTDDVRNEPSKSNERIMLPGDKEILESRARHKNGVPLDDLTVELFKDLAIKYNVDLEFL